jgi:hypothetical protein
MNSALCIHKRSCITAPRATSFLSALCPSASTGYRCKAIDILIHPSCVGRRDIALARIRTLAATAVLVPIRWCPALLRRFYSFYTTFSRQIKIYCPVPWVIYRPLVLRQCTLMYNGYDRRSQEADTSWLGNKAIITAHAHILTLVIIIITITSLTRRTDIRAPILTDAPTTRLLRCVSKRFELYTDISPLRIQNTQNLLHLI